jgi:hypothetical protein
MVRTGRLDYVVVDDRMISPITHDTLAEQYAFI